MYGSRVHSPSRYLTDLPRAPSRRRRVLFFVALSALFIAMAFFGSLHSPPGSTHSPATNSFVLVQLVVIAVFATVFLLRFRARREHSALASVSSRSHLALAQGDVTQAHDLLRAALAKRPSARSRAELLSALSLVALERGDFSDAFAIIIEAEDTLRRNESSVASHYDTLRATLRVNGAEALLGLGRLDEAARRLDPLPETWMPLQRSYAIFLTICITAGKRDFTAALALIREHTALVENSLPMRSRWLLRAIELFAINDTLTLASLPDDPALSRWMSLRFPQVPDVLSSRLSGVRGEA